MPGFPRQEMARRADDANHEIGGIDGSRFRHGGDLRGSWQSDFFDFGNAAGLFLEMMTDGTPSKGMSERLERSLGQPLPGHHPTWTAPVGTWEVPQ